jgi:hypothetical protein
MNTWGAWIPNIVCTIVGAAIGWGISSKTTDMNIRMLRTVLTTLENSGQFGIELARDSKGELTGGRVIRLKANATSKSTASADLTAGPASMVGTGSTSTPPN